MIMPQILKQLKSENSTIAEYITLFFVKASKWDAGLQWIFSEKSLILFKEILNSKDDVIKIRVLDTFCHISASSSASFTLCLKHGFLDEVVKIVVSDDILLQLNAMELLIKVFTEINMTFVVDEHPRRSHLP